MDAEQNITFADFAGAWTVDRQIQDFQFARQGQFSGRAVFSPQADRLHYRETGNLHMPGQKPMLATRDYIWQGHKDQVEVTFVDGRPFHRFSLTEYDPVDTHDCPPDVYRVQYGFADWPHWQTSWSVNGPNKSYQMVSRYSR